MDETKARWGSLFKNGLALYTIMLNVGIGLHAVDVFIVTTIMPSVVHDIGGEAYYTWATMLYMVASIIGAATGAPVKSAFGPRRSYCLGALLFLAGSVGCAVSPTIFVLLAMRLVQGFGGGLIIALSMGLIRELYPEAVRKRALALVSSTWGVAALIGPAVGGSFAQIGFWRGAFWLNAPIILAFMLAAWFRLPERLAAPPGGRFPYRRMAMLSVGVLCVGVAGNWQSVGIQIVLIAAAVLLVWQTLRLDRTDGSKLFPSHPFSPRTTTGSANWVFFLSSITHTVIGVYLPLALQVVHGVDPLEAGYITASLAVCWTIASMATAHVHGRAASVVIVFGQCMCCIGLGALAFGLERVPTEVVPILNGLVGIGLGCSNLHVTEATMRHAATGEEMLTASSIPTIRSLGIAFGAAGAGVIANSAGLTLAASDIARAVTAVLAVGVLAPFVALLMSLRFVALIASAPSQAPARSAPGSAGATH